MIKGHFFQLLKNIMIPTNKPLFYRVRAVYANHFAFIDRIDILYARLIFTVITKRQ